MVESYTDEVEATSPPDFFNFTTSTPYHPNTGTMAPKGKSKPAAAAADTKVKGAQSINVRHILCAKHAKKEEAAEKLRSGAKFDDVAREFSEDKARQGTIHKSQAEKRH